jgi:hypothetical protein
MTLIVTRRLTGIVNSDRTGVELGVTARAEVFRLLIFTAFQADTAIFFLGNFRSIDASASIPDFSFLSYEFQFRS